MRTKPDVCVGSGAEKSEEIGGGEEKQSEGMTNAVKTTCLGTPTIPRYCIMWSILLLPWHFCMLH